MPGTRLARKTLTQFGTAANPNDMGVFGSEASGGVQQTSTDIPTIISLAAWVNGWASAIVAQGEPNLEDFNGLCFVLCYFACYLLRVGIAEWDSGTEYFQNDLVSNGAGVAPPGAPAPDPIVFQCIKSSDSSSINEIPAATPASWRQLNLRSKLNPQVTTALETRAMGTWASQTAGGNRAYSDVIWIPDVAVRKFCSVSTDGYVQYSSDGKSWTEVNPGAGNKQWNSVTWSPELQRAVAVSTDGFAMYSGVNDLTTWTLSSTVPEANVWQSVVWADGLGIFVAVSSTGTHRVMTSSDGNTWSAVSAAAAHSWSSICWSDNLGLLVATAFDGFIMTSSLGSSGWALSTPAVAGLALEGVCWSSDVGIFVLVAGSGTNRAQFSYDGVTWFSGLLTTGNAWIRVTYCRELGVFVAVCQGTAQIATSSDGYTWVVVTVPQANSWNGVAWSGYLGIAAAVASTGAQVNKVMISKYVKTFLAI